MFKAGLRSIGWIVSALVLAAVVWWALRQPAPTLPSSRSDLTALALAVVFYAGCTILRAERWRTLLYDVDARPSRGDAYRLVLIGYMGNNVLPARAGDLMRVVLMAPRADTTKRYVVGTLLAERLLDIAVLVTLFVVLATTVAGGAGLPGAGTLEIIGGLVALAAAVGIAAYVVLHRRGLKDRARAFAAPMAISTRNLRGRHGLGMLLLTILIWLGEAAVWGACAAAVNLDAGPLEALYLVALASMFSLIPSGPGYAGTQDAAAVIGVKAIGGTSAQAVSYLILVRFVLLVPITVAGLIALVSRYGGVKGLRLATQRTAEAGV
ncbi:MAG: flippase-like domain-containing protein [Solirubrobacterales bacterium]|nr:flippase-like domain-containing protein [Solirubrobacterales bacterium]